MERRGLVPQNMIGASIDCDTYGKYSFEPIDLVRKILALVYFVIKGIYMHMLGSRSAC